MCSQIGWRVRERTPHPATRTKPQPGLSRCTRLGRPNAYSNTSRWFRVWGAIKTRTLGGFRQRKEGTIQGAGQDLEARQQRRRQQGRRKTACSPWPTEARSSPLALPAARPACAVMAGAAPVTVRAAPARPPSARSSGPRWPRASLSYRPPTRRRPPRTPSAAPQSTKAAAPPSRPAAHGPPRSSPVPPGAHLSATAAATSQSFLLRFGARSGRGRARPSRDHPALEGRGRASGTTPRRERARRPRPAVPMLSTPSCGRGWSLSLFWSSLSLCVEHLVASWF